MRDLQPASADLSVRGFVHDMVDMAMDDWQRPSFRAGAAVTAASTVVLARLGVRPFLIVPIAVSLGASAMGVYEMAQDITARVGGANAAGTA